MSTRVAKRNGVVILKPNGSHRFNARPSTGLGIRSGSPFVGVRELHTKRRSSRFGRLRRFLGT